MPKNSEYLMKIDDTLVNKDYIDINDSNFKKIMFLYESAIKEMKTKLEILRDELKLFSNYEPIEYISTRIKKPKAIIDKMKRKNYDLTYKNMFEKINDIAGVRIVCDFKRDVYKIIEIIDTFQDIRILNKKDFLKTPKKSGYMSYHLITEVPVTFSSGTMFIKIEVQIRTLGMDFWANIEHKLKYKNDNISKNESKNLIKYAHLINNIDENMLTISNNIEDKKIIDNITFARTASAKEIGGKNKKFNL